MQWGAFSIYGGTEGHMGINVSAGLGFREEPLRVDTKGEPQRDGH